jgi:hypothetical protein
MGSRDWPLDAVIALRVKSLGAALSDEVDGASGADLAAPKSKQPAQHDMLRGWPL